MCEEFRRLPDALERAAELDKQYGAKPDLAKLPMYCAVFSLKNWYDAKDNRCRTFDRPHGGRPNLGSMLHGERVARGGGGPQPLSLFVEQAPSRPHIGVGGGQLELEQRASAEGDW